MPKTKKKRPEENRKRSTSRANIFFIVNIVLILFLGYLRFVYNVDVLVILTTYLIITAVALALLHFKDRRAADEALSMMGIP